MKSSSLLAWLALLPALLRPSDSLNCVDQIPEALKTTKDCGPVSAGKCCSRMETGVGVVKRCGAASRMAVVASWPTKSPLTPSLAMASAFSCEGSPKCLRMPAGDGRWYKVCSCTADNCNDEPCPEDCPKAAPDTGSRCRYQVKGSEEVSSYACSTMNWIWGEDFGQCCLRLPPRSPLQKTCGFASDSAAKAYLREVNIGRPPTQSEVSAHSCQGGPKCTLLPDVNGALEETCSCDTDDCNDRPCPDECAEQGAGQDSGTRNSGRRPGAQGGPRPPPPPPRPPPPPLSPTPTPPLFSILSPTHIPHQPPFTSPPLLSLFPYPRL